MSEKLQKILAARGLCSRREAETWITRGRVTVNGRPATLGDRAEPESDRILVDGKPLPPLEEGRYFLHYKPRGVVTSLRDERGRPDLGPLLKRLGLRLFPVGRLDRDSEGLLLLTNDGGYANRCAHPSRAVVKAYLVWVEPRDGEAVARLREPVPLEDGVVQADYVLPTGLPGALLIGIHQGKNRQVRRMCEYCGLRVTRLKRVAEGALVLGSLRSGEIRELTKEEAELVFRTIAPEGLLPLGGEHV